MYRRHPAVRPPHSLAALAFLTFVALQGCGGGEEDERARVEAVAGTYARETTDQAGPGGQIVHQRVALTVRPDGRWTMLREATVDGAPFVSAADSGTYRLEGATLTTTSPESGAFGYTVAGDTLWMSAADQRAATRAVTGIDAGPGGGYLVRER